jgi:hypothetical protein
MPVFFSKNNTEPYEIIDDIRNINVDVYVDDFKTDEVKEIDGHFYLIVENENLSNLEVEVVNSSGFGIAFEISLADLIGNPTEWKTKVSIGDVDATDKTLKFLFYYRWKVINNLQIVKPDNYSATLVAYADE